MIVCNLRIALTLILSFFSLTLLGQSLDSIEKEEDIKSLLEGYWKNSEVNSENVTHIWLEKGKLILENVEINFKTNHYESKGIHITFIEIKKRGRKYWLKFNSLYSSSKAKIKCLNKEQMILKRNGKEEIYNKII